MKQMVSRTIYAVFIASLLGVSMVSAASKSKHALPVAGWVEKASLVAHGLDLHAKLDSGARTTSINTVAPEHFERDGEDWVRFSLRNRYGKSTTVEMEVVREAKIKRHFDARQHRPVILLDICIGPARKTVEVTLVDRTGLNYQLLIGRNFLADNLLVDSGRTYIMPSVCSAF